jgi:hypothetical protein
VVRCNVTITLDVKPETAAKLEAAARALNISLNDYLDKVAEIVVSVSIDQEGQLPHRNEAMIAALRQSAERRFGAGDQWRTAGRFPFSQEEIDASQTNLYAPNQRTTPSSLRMVLAHQVEYESQ